MILRITTLRNKSKGRKRGHSLMEVRYNHTRNQDSKLGMLLRRQKNGNETHVSMCFYNSVQYSPTFVIAHSVSKQLFRWLYASKSIVSNEAY